MIHPSLNEVEGKSLIVKMVDFKKIVSKVYEVWTPYVPLCFGLDELEELERACEDRERWFLSWPLTLLLMGRS